MYKILLCSRYLRTRYIALASIISVMLGVATMIVVNSVMAGFATQMKDRIHNILADMVLEAHNNTGEPDAELQMKKIMEVAGEYIDALTPTVETYAMITVQSRGDQYTKPVNLIGINPVSKAKVGKLTEHLGNYQPEKEGDKVINPPLRTLETPPDWELSPHAMEERRQRVERQMWAIQHQLSQADEPALPATGTGSPASTATTDDATINNPFANQEEERPLTAEERAAPQVGRVYAGIGIISWQEPDQQGKERTRMIVNPGEDISITTAAFGGGGPKTVSSLATIVDTFRSGMGEYDSNLVFANLEFVQKLRGMEEKDSQGNVTHRYFSTIQIKLKDYSQAPEVEKLLRMRSRPIAGRFGPGREKQGPLLAAVAVESAILNVLLFLIIAVAGFGILAIFFMIVVEKTRDIGILKALGASSRGIQSIFLSYGLALGMVGSGVGVILGLLFVWNINWIESWLTWMTGHKVFDERIYYFPEIPTHIEPLMVFWVALGATAIAVLASIFPARRAASLHPVESLRYE